MAMPRLWWLDDRDRYLAGEIIREVKAEKLASWEWKRYVEDDQRIGSETTAQAAVRCKKALLTAVGTCSMFKPGKVVYCYGIPSFQSDLAKELFVADKVLLVLVAKIDKSTALYKAALKMEESKLARIDEAESVKPHRAQEWVSKRAAELGMKMDPAACKLIVDIVGFKGPYDPVMDQNKMHMEILKVRDTIPGDVAAPWAVEQVAIGDGSASTKSLQEAIVAGDIGAANKVLCRMLSRGDSPMGIVGFLADWVRKLAVIEGASVDDRAGLVSRMRKRGTEHGPGEIEEWGWVKKRYEPVPMYPKTGALAYAHKDSVAMGKKRGWCARVMGVIGKAEIDMRLDKAPFENEADGMMYHPDQVGRRLADLVNFMIGRT